MESICCVCKFNYQGSHCCSSCKMPCHAICGDAGDEEGYGAQVVCFNCKKSVATGDDEKDDNEPQFLKELGVEAAYIPGGCTKFIQAPYVCWNKPFKERIRHYYSLWITNGDRQEYTAAGNPKAPALEVVLDWVDRSWQELSKEMIIKSFEVCGLATTSDGYGDDRINCFKPDGSIGTRGIDLLREFRGKETMKDGRNDVEEAGLSEDENNVELSGVGEDDELFFQI
uniref:SCAN domain-containing protein n=1 Tax=Globodera rostochiensis TaxID=31243 RepID=A0A914H5L2_GLORO